MSTAHDHPFRSCVPFLLPLLLGAAVGANADAQDSRSFTESLFLPSGPAGTATAMTLWNPGPPQLGSSVESVLMAPGRSVGAVFVAAGATAGTLMATPCGYSLRVYVDLSAQLGSIPMVLSATGRGTAVLGLPYVPSLVGLDLAWQAAAIGSSCDLAASNLVIGNIGSDPNTSGADIAFTFGPIPIPPASTWSVGGTPMPVITNSTSGNTQPYWLVGTKSAGTLLLVSTSGTVVATAPSGAGPFTLAANVPPNQPRFLRNGGSAALTVSWRMVRPVF
jgi:hypothetical protein